MRWAFGFWTLVVVLRLGYALLAPSIDPFLRRDPLHGDAQVHDQIAWTLANEGRYEFLKGLQTAPGYLFLMAGVYAIVGHEPQAVRFVNGLLGVLSLWGIFLLARRWLGERPAYWVVGLCAVHPHLLMISGWLYTENLVLPLVVWGMVLAVQPHSLRNAVMLGATLGLLALTRANFLPFIGLVAVWWVVRAVVPPRDGLPIRSVVVMLLTATLVITPYLIYLYGRFGYFIPVSLGGYTFLWANNPEADGGFRADFVDLRMLVEGQEVRVRDYIASPDPVERDRKALRLALDWIRDNPTDFLNLLWRKTRLSLSAFGLQEAGNRRLANVLRLADGVYWLFLLGAHWGFLWGFRAHWREWGLIAILWGWTWLGIWLYAGGSRPLLPVMPFVVLFFVRGVGLIGLARQRPRGEDTAPR
ncbi:MAG: glycosyltransferase family 39 protein [Fimbriimonadales bacterium]